MMAGQLLFIAESCGKCGDICIVLALGSHVYSEFGLDQTEFSLLDQPKSLHMFRWPQTERKL